METSRCHFEQQQPSLSPTDIVIATKKCVVYCFFLIQKMYFIFIAINTLGGGEEDTLWKWFGRCCGLNCVPPNSYGETLTLNVIVFGDRAFVEVIKVKWSLQGEAPIHRASVFMRKRDWLQRIHSLHTQTPRKGHLRTRREGFFLFSTILEVLVL